MTPAALSHLSATVRAGFVSGYAESIQTVFLIAVPIAALAFLASWLIPQVELKQWAPAAPAAPTSEAQAATVDAASGLDADPGRGRRQRHGGAIGVARPAGRRPSATAAGDPTRANHCDAVRGGRRRARAENAERFAALFELPAAHGSYESLVDADPSVDLVYVATPHPFHYPQREARARRGQARPGREPFTLNAAAAPAAGAHAAGQAPAGP